MLVCIQELEARYTRLRLEVEAELDRCRGSSAGGAPLRMDELARRVIARERTQVAANSAAQHAPRTPASSANDVTSEGFGMPYAFYFYLEQYAKPQCWYPLWQLCL